MDAATRRFVRQRAGEQCEYCRMPQAATAFIPFHIEHILATQHRVDDSLENLCLACDRCNAFKGPNLSSIDPDTGQVTPLFHPQRDPWTEHFRMDGLGIIGQTPSRRATVRLLEMNATRTP